MGLLDRFKREAECDKCQIVFPKTKLSYFDSSFRKERQNGRQLRLCRACFTDEIRDWFRNYKHMAVAVYPSEGYNAYHFYSFKDLEKYNFEPEFIAGLRSLLPTSTPQCELCIEEAHFVWCSPDIYFDDPFSPELNTNEQVKKQYLCGNCLAKEFTNRIYEEDLYFDEFWPPVDTNGFCTSFDC